MSKICRQYGYKIYQHSPLQDPQKFIQIGILGLKIIWQPAQHKAS
jgi:hypothetical protein